MDILYELVKVLDDESYKDFMVYLERHNKRADVKNIALLRLIKTDDIDGIYDLYPNLKKDRNAYHALRKRLTDALLEFLLNNNALHKEADEAVKAQQYVALGKFLLEKQLIVIGQKQLQKAVDIASLTAQYGLLNEIYLLQLQHSATSCTKEELNILTYKLQSNQQNIIHEGKMHIAFAIIRQQLSQIQLKNEVINLTDLILCTLNELDLDIDAVINYKSIYQILHIANEFAAIYQDYSLIEQYIIKSEHLLSKTNDLSSSSSYHILSILYYLSNFYFRNHQFDKSAHYLEKLSMLLSNNATFHAAFSVKVSMLQSLVHFYTNHWDSAVEIAENILLLPTKAVGDAQDLLDIHICLIMYYGVIADKKALKHLALLNHTDTWYEKEKGMLWTVRKNLMEIVMHIQFENIDLAHSRLISFKRRYTTFLKKAHEHRVLEYLKIVEGGILKTNRMTHNLLLEKLDKVLNNTTHQDIFILSFEAWLIGVLERKSAYEYIIDKIKRKP